MFEVERDQAVCDESRGERERANGCVGCSGALPGVGHQAEVVGDERLKAFCFSDVVGGSDSREVDRTVGISFRRHVDRGSKLAPVELGLVREVPDEEAGDGWRLAELGLDGPKALRPGTMQDPETAAFLSGFRAANPIVLLSFSPYRRQ